MDVAAAEALTAQGLGALPDLASLARSQPARAGAALEQALGSAKFAREALQVRPCSLQVLFCRAFMLPVSDHKPLLPWALRSRVPCQLLHVRHDSLK